MNLNRPEGSGLSREASARGRGWREGADRGSGSRRLAPEPKRYREAACKSRSRRKRWRDKQEGTEQLPSSAGSDRRGLPAARVLDRRKSCPLSASLSPAHTEPTRTTGRARRSLHPPPCRSPPARQPLGPEQPVAGPPRNRRTARAGGWTLAVQWRLRSRRHGTRSAACAGCRRRMRPPLRRELRRTVRQVPQQGARPNPTPPREHRTQKSLAFSPRNPPPRKWPDSSALYWPANMHSPRTALQR